MFILLIYLLNNRIENEDNIFYNYFTLDIKKNNFYNYFTLDLSPFTIENYIPSSEIPISDPQVHNTINSSLNVFQYFTSIDWIYCINLTLLSGTVLAGGYLCYKLYNAYNYINTIANRPFVLINEFFRSITSNTLDNDLSPEIRFYGLLENLLSLFNINLEEFSIDNNYNEGLFDLTGNTPEITRRNIFNYIFNSFNGFLMDTIEYLIDPLSLPEPENQNIPNDSGFESLLEDNHENNPEFYFNIDSEDEENDSVITENDPVITENESVITENNSEQNNSNNFVRRLFNTPQYPNGFRINANGFLNLRRPMMRTDFSLIDSVSISTTSTPYNITEPSFNGNSWATNSLIEFTENLVNLEDSIISIVTLTTLYI